MKPVKRARTEDRAQSGRIDAIPVAACIEAETTVDHGQVVVVQDVPCIGGEIIVGETESDESKVAISIDVEDLLVVEDVPCVGREVIVGEIEDDESKVVISFESASASESDVSAWLRCKWLAHAAI